MSYSTAIASSEHVDDIARIGYEAFREVSDRHGLEPDFPTVSLARQVYRMLIDRPDYYGVVSLLDGKVIGSNFLSTTDPVAGIGPLSVAPGFQGKGVGRALMQNVMAYAEQHGITQVRLLQDTHNPASLSLYSSLGFEVRDVVALTATVKSDRPDFSIRAVRKSDLSVLDELAQKLYKVSRHNETAIALKYGFPILVREEYGRVAGYLIPGLVGHGVSVAADDALALICEAARAVPGQFSKIFCPLRQSELFRGLLRSGGTVEKTLSYMTLGPFEYPEGVCTPSAGY